MADHIVTQIRDAVKTLVTGLSTTAANAYAGRNETRPLQPGELPGLLVYTKSADGELSSGQQGGRRVAYVMDVVIEAYVHATGDVDAALDRIMKEVHVALAAKPTLDGKCKDLWLRAFEKEQDDEAAKPTWKATMIFECEYHIRETAPDAALP